MRKPVIVAILCFSATLGAARAETQRSQAVAEEPGPTELRSGSDSRATLADFSFLVGRWRGEALGGVAEEVWLEPAGGAMVGTFRMVKDGEVSFYEIFTISEPDLTLRLKHFHADLTGWEEREEVVSFPFVRASEREAVFEGLTFRLLPDGRLRAAVETEDGDGSTGELVFVYERVP